MMTIGFGALIGAALGLRFNVFALFPTIILAAIGITAIELASGNQLGSIALAIVLVTIALQIGYLAGSIIHAALGRRVAPSIQERMEVVGSDGQHVGTIDHKEAADQLVLAGDDPKAGGKPHLISVDWVDFVDSKVHLNKPAEKAVLEWRVAA
jgi:hypothetical protein